MNLLSLKSISPPPCRGSFVLAKEGWEEVSRFGLILNSNVSVGRNLIFESRVCFMQDSVANRTKIGSYSYCSYNSKLNTATIGRYCSIGYNVEFGLGEHHIDWMTTSEAVLHNIFFMEYSGVIPLRRNQFKPDGESSSEVTLGHDVWVGCNCLFPKDVTVGHGAVIGAGSIITHDVPPYAIVAGVGGGENSKGIIKGYRFADEIISDLLELSWWNYDIPKMIAQGIKVPVQKPKDFITFMKNEEREKLIPLTENWYYLNVIDSNTVELYHVDPEQTYMGSHIKPANIAIINDPERGAEPIVIKAQE